MEVDRSPLWPDAPRYCPSRSMPAYRFRPGFDPHPTQHPDGYGYGSEHKAIYVEPSQWRDNEDYLFAIDLYHQGYYWAAHEMWEGLWRLTASDCADSRLYRGLIQLAAAELKRAVEVPRGAAILSYRARANLVCLPDPFMGLALPAVLDQLDRRFSPLWRNRDLPLGAGPVLLQLATAE